MISKIIISSFCVVFLYTIGVQSYGRVLDPVHRGGAWRLGLGTPINYDDHMNQCGGYIIQYQKNKGKCGVCGDNYADEKPQANQNHGTYGTGTIVKTYTENELITVTVELTANLGGYFEFSICSIDMTTDGLETEDCFQNLPLEDGITTKYHLPDDKAGERQIKLQLPEDFYCEQCSLRWQYTAANNWGICEDGTGKLGCGPQETFRTCSDVQIKAKNEEETGR
ncbi:hypothetical protein QAD02_006529 [Eretmocerus hayati]|uniref:Uncharacterized protein n=1 Tax=Eretmocerus hayati TaxID=131215 RepID=A0ACC2N1H2_9HYME|nr:hypothetical protein QAD02_006529 [Eretmocerus hayati]